MEVSDFPRPKDHVVGQLWHLILEIPLETLALQLLPECQSVADIPKVPDVVLDTGPRDAEPVPVELLVLVNWYLALGAWYLTLGTWDLRPGTWYLVLGTRLVVHGAKYQYLVL